MAKKHGHPHRGQVANSAAYAALSENGRAFLGALQESGREEILIGVEPGRFVNVRLPYKWRKYGATSRENIKCARNTVDLAEAALEAGRATKQWA
jgi:hypothetical protein